MSFEHSEKEIEISLSNLKIIIADSSVNSFE